MGARYTYIPEDLRATDVTCMLMFVHSTILWLQSSSSELCPAADPRVAANKLAVGWAL